MNQAAPELAARATDARVDQIIKLAIMAVGGQGGGVLTNWIVALAERNGYAVQATSVAGVAQRTGATIYYVEMLPEADGAAPVFALAPAEGDVDILIAAEMMEAGRAVMRGFVTPERTTLIASTHRALAVSEKVVPGSGVSDSDAVRAAAQAASAEFIAFDMEAMALKAGSVISAGLFGALAGSGALPFEAESFRDTIRASERGVEGSLKAFELARVAAEARAEDAAPAPTAQPAQVVQGPDTALRQYETLAARLTLLPEPVQEMAAAGLRRVVDFQDVAYGGEYLDRVEALAKADTAGKGFDFTVNAAKYIANAMCYDDLIRVADLKTRASRFARVETEIAAGEGTLMQVTEYLHPGAAEFVSLMPARLGRFVERREGLFRLIDRLTNRGRRMRSDRLLSFLMLYVVGGLRRWRRGTLRHAIEMAHMAAWLELARERRSVDYAFAVETLKMRRLIKGYSDTHARGLSKFDRVLEGSRLVAGREDAAEWLRRLITAALADPQGEALEGALATIRTFAPEGAAPKEIF